MLHLLDFAPEVIHEILTEVDITDLAAISRTCHHLRDYVAGDVLLWKNHYLKHFDQPRPSAIDGDAFWRGRSQTLIELQKILQSYDGDLKRRMVKRVCTTAEELLEDAPRNSKKSRNVAFLSDLFERKDNISHLMCRSSLFKEAGKADESPAESDEERQQSAKLHVLYGCSIEPSEEDMDRMLARAIHPYARSRVYDLRRYKRSNFWGPFMDDHSQRVDWEKVQAILIDLNYNLQVLSDRTDGQFSLLWDKPFEGLTQDSFSSRPLPCLKQAPTPLDAEDPYGVTGTWMRIVCFLDYTHLFTFNFESEMIPADQEREPICTEEAIRLIFLKLRVTSVEPAGEDDMQGTVVTHFTGSSRSMHMSWDPNANSRIRGSVRTTPSGAVRWTTFSIYHGQERWRSEGIQLGGRRSARGIVGTWFDRGYSARGPAGPTAFWKLSDDVVEEKHPPVHPFPFTALF